MDPCNNQTQPKLAELAHYTACIEAASITALSALCRAASAQQELEGSVNGLKKETGAQLRELACDKGEALRALQAAKQAAEQRQHQLQARLAAIS